MQFGVEGNTDTTCHFLNVVCICVLVCFPHGSKILFCLSLGNDVSNSYSNVSGNNTRMEIYQCSLCHLHRNETRPIVCNLVKENNLIPSGFRNVLY